MGNLGWELNKGVIHVPYFHMIEIICLLIVILKVFWKKKKLRFIINITNNIFIIALIFICI